MKFTQGYWMIKQNYIMSYATHAVRVTKTDKEMQEDWKIYQHTLSTK